MSFEADKLYQLLPAVYRNRDAEHDEVLKQLIALIAGQVAVLEENFEQLYDNQFVETAVPWALPYLGDLLGIRGLLTGATARSPRAEVGHTVAYRRRKGTAPMLELLARDVTGWPARAVEFFERLAATQHLNHLRPECQSFASLRNARELEFVGTPFERLRRTGEVRHIESGHGKWNIPNVGLFLWRLRSYSRTASPMVPVGELSPGDALANRRFRVHPLGFDSQLFILPVTEDDITHLAEPINVPLPITRRMLAAKEDENFAPSAALYGPGLSVSIERWVLEQTVLGQLTPAHYEPIPPEQVIVCDLSDVKDDLNNSLWNHETKATVDQVAIDPVLGRIILGSVAADHPSPRATYHYGFSFDLGGGEYPRTGSFDASSPTTILVPQALDATLPNFDTLANALNELGTNAGCIEVTTSGRFTEALPELVANGISQGIRASDKRCPVILLLKASGSQPWTIRGDADGSVSLNGLWMLWPRDIVPPPVSEPVPALRVTGDLRNCKLQHCTLAPEWFWRSGSPGELVSAPTAYLEISATGIQATIENCVLPALRVGDDGVRVHLRNCVIDAGGQENFALSNLAADGPAGSWRLENCTIIGQAWLDSLELASNCIFYGQSVSVRRRQEGCVRFSWLPNSAQTRTPRRYRCLPSATGENADIRPEFMSLRFGVPAYAQLSRSCPAAIRTGADDGSEMGAFHDLFQAQREAHLRSRLGEYLETRTRSRRFLRILIFTP